MFEVVDNVFVLGVHSDLPVGGEGFVGSVGVGKRFHLTALSEKILAGFNLPKKKTHNKEAVAGLLYHKLAISIKTKQCKIQPTK